MADRNRMQQITLERILLPTIVTPQCFDIIYERMNTRPSSLSQSPPPFRPSAVMSKGRNFGTGGTLVALLAAAGAGASFPFYYARGAVKVRSIRILNERMLNPHSGRH